MFSLQNLHHSAHYCKTLLYLLVNADSDLLTGSGSDFKYIIVRTKEKKITIWGGISDKIYAFTKILKKDNDDFYNLDKRFKN